MDASRIKMLVMDVDGTLTDGSIYMGPNGEEMKVFDVKDGYAIANMLPEMGILPVIITGRKSRIVEQRCAELGIMHLYQGVSNKLETLLRLLEEQNLKLENVAYMGDDFNDLECMKAVAADGGIPACPADAADVVRNICAYVAVHRGGKKAVREFIEQLQESTYDSCTA